MFTYLECFSNHSMYKIDHSDNFPTYGLRKLLFSKRNHYLPPELPLCLSYWPLTNEDFKLGEEMCPLGRK